jgi:hypothetical protein
VLSHKSLVIVLEPPLMQLHSDSTKGIILSTGGIGKGNLVEMYLHR